MFWPGLGLIIRGSCSFPETFSVFRDIVHLDSKREHLIASQSKGNSTFDRLARGLLLTPARFILLASPAPVYLGEPLGQHDRSADELCDDLFIHMLDCDHCLDPDDCQCSIFENLQCQIVAKGGANRASVYAV